MKKININTAVQNLTLTELMQIRDALKTILNSTSQDVNSEFLKALVLQIKQQNFEENK